MQGKNLSTARRTWGPRLPRWIELLANACDRTSQRKVADDLQFSNSYVSRLISNSYPGDLAEAERQVLANLTSDRVDCPFWRRPIPLSSCIRARRKESPQGAIFMAQRRACDACPRNTDQGE